MRDPEIVSQHGNSKIECAIKTCIKNGKVMCAKFVRSFTISNNNVWV